ncbi:MAG TPA: hypothetical protein VF434_11865 [Promineifilum sp.]
MVKPRLLRWSPVNGNLLKRRDFTFRELLTRAKRTDMPLFAGNREAFIPPARARATAHPFPATGGSE